MKVLMVVRSHASLGETGKPTGFWLEELALPYMELSKRGAEIDIASPRGGRAPVDPASEKSEDADVRAFRSDKEAARKLEATIPLSDVTERYDAVFVAGGHGVMWDLPQSEALAKILSHTYEHGGVVAAVCHGPAALVNVKLENGSPLVRGKRLTAFSDEEEDLVGLSKVVPFMLERRLTEVGAIYERAAKWSAHAVRDGRLVTGQNPAS